MNPIDDEPQPAEHDAVRRSPREAREAAALRANLRRRKEQKRAREAARALQREAKPEE